MRFQSKVFLASFFSCATALALLTFSMEEALRRSLEQDYRARYAALGEVIGTTLRQMEHATARISEVAVQGLKGRVEAGGILSEEELLHYRKALGVSQLVITDRSGNILRDTETPPADRTAKLFDFCEGYRDLLNQPGRIESTPVLPSFPSGQSFLFSMTAGPAGTGIVEAGMHVSFVVETLKRALAADPNIQTLGLYAPGGFPLGVAGGGKEGQAPEALPGLEAGTFSVSDGRLAVVTLVPAASPDCCECKKKGLVDANGHYFYFLRTEVSLAALIANQKLLRDRALLFLGISLLLAALFSFFTSVQLVRRLRQFHEGVERIGASGKLGDRLQLEGKDEVGALAKAFNGLSARLEESQRRTLELEKSRALAEMATRVAHDIRSPLAVLKSLDRDLADSGFKEGRLLRAAIERIQKIAQDLLSTYRLEKAAPVQVRSLGDLLEETLALKEKEFGGQLKGSLRLSFEKGAASAFVSISASHLGRVLSNLINNSFEATSFTGEVVVAAALNGEMVEVTVRDNGPGISPARLAQLRELGGTFGKENGLGLGLVQARETAERAGGTLHIESEEGKGTRVILRVPRREAPAWFLGQLEVKGRVVIVDDDPSVHRAWEERFLALANPVEIEHLFALGELKAANLEGEATFLVDQQVGNSAETGLAVILRLGIRDRSVLVTSYADEPSLQDECARAGLPLLEKSRIASIEIKRR